MFLILSIVCPISWKFVPEGYVLLFATEHIGIEQLTDIPDGLSYDNLLALLDKTSELTVDRVWT